MHLYCTLYGASPEMASAGAVGDWTNLIRADWSLGGVWRQDYAPGAVQAQGLVDESHLIGLETVQMAHSGGWFHELSLIF